MHSHSRGMSGNFGSKEENCVRNLFGLRITLVHCIGSCDGCHSLLVSHRIAEELFSVKAGALTLWVSENLNGTYYTYSALVDGESL